MGIILQCAKGAMNTIHTTTKRSRLPYTVVGGARLDTRKQYPVELTLLVLSRGSRIYRGELLNQIAKLGIPEVLFLEGPGESYEIETLSVRHPKIRFLLLHESVSPGERINIGIDEAHGRYILVLWDDIKIVPPLISDRFMERVEEYDILCTAPLLQNERRQTLPTVGAPAYNRGKLELFELAPASDRVDTLFPFDYIGIYGKERFEKTGGYDPGITNPYWQKLDFGFRSYMWGESIQCAASFRLQYLFEPPEEDETPDESYKLFYLKNLALRFNGDSAALPMTRFLRYAGISDSGFFESLAEFKEVRKWADINKYRFTQDARSVTELWEIPEK